jgi:hypothetical protein
MSEPPEDKSFWSQVRANAIGSAIGTGIVAGVVALVTLISGMDLKDVLLVALGVIVAAVLVARTISRTLKAELEWRMRVAGRLDSLEEGAQIVRLMSVINEAHRYNWRIETREEGGLRFTSPDNEAVDVAPDALEPEAVARELHEADPECFPDGEWEELTPNHIEGELQRTREGRGGRARQLARPHGIPRAGTRASQECLPY